MFKTLLPFALLACVSACSAPSAPRGGAPEDIYQRSVHELVQPPQAAAACIERNARALGHAAAPTPLYGTAVMAVIVSTLAAGGDTIASVQLLPEAAGSRAQVTSTSEMLRERPDVIRSLINGC